MIIINKLSKSIVFSLIFIFIFNFSSVVAYSSVQHKNEKSVLGGLASAGLATLTLKELIATLTSMLLRNGFVMDTTTHMTVNEFIQEYPDVVNDVKNFGKSENGLIAVSKNAFKKFKNFVNNLVNQGGKEITSSRVSISSDPDDADYGGAFNGLSISNSKKIRVYRFSTFDSNNVTLTVNPGERGVFYLTQNSSFLWQYNLRMKILRADGTQRTSARVNGFLEFSTVLLPGEKIGDIIDDAGNIFDENSKGDFILNPSWDIGANSGSMAGFPPLPWDKDFTSTGNIGILNPDGIIDGNPAIPDNPSIPDTDTDTDKGILGWLSNFWENLWSFFMELIKKLFYPEMAIGAWSGFKDNFTNKFKFIGQIEELKWSTSNNEKFSMILPIAGFNTLIEFPQALEDQVPLLRNLLKYFFYISTLFIVVAILRPKFNINSD